MEQNSGFWNNVFPQLVNAGTSIAKIFTSSSGGNQISNIDQIGPYSGNKQSSDSLFGNSSMTMILLAGAVLLVLVLFLDRK